MNVKIKKLHPNAVIPTYGTAGAAAFDLYACADTDGYGRTVVSTGLAFEIPEGHVMFIKPRSGIAFKEGIQAFSGTIDSDYRGEIKVLLTADDEYIDIIVKAGHRVAQAVIMPVPRITFEDVDELSDTSRGTGGFGSTG
jgi:dUTP pyrophosphatase